MKSLASLTCVAILCLASSAFANPIPGSIASTSRVEAYSTNVHTILYAGGEQADFAVTGDGTSTLNVIVEDQNGNEIVRTRGPGDICHVYWTPARTGVFYIRVVNEGSVWNQYSYRAY